MASPGAHPARPSPATTTRPTIGQSGGRAGRRKWTRRRSGTDRRRPRARAHSGSRAPPASGCAGFATLAAVARAGVGTARRDLRPPLRTESSPPRRRARGPSHARSGRRGRAAELPRATSADRRGGRAVTGRRGRACARRTLVEIHGSVAGAGALPVVRQSSAGSPRSLRPERRLPAELERKCEIDELAQRAQAGRSPRVCSRDASAGGPHERRRGECPSSPASSRRGPSCRRGHRARTRLRRGRETAPGPPKRRDRRPRPVRAAVGREEDECALRARSPGGRRLRHTRAPARSALPYRTALSFAPGPTSPVSRWRRRGRRHATDPGRRPSRS